MTPLSDKDGLSLLGKLDRYWTSRSPSQPRLLPNERLICISPEHWIKYALPSVFYFFLTAFSVALLWFASVGASSLFGFSMLFGAGLILLVCTHHWFFWFLLAESQACIIVTDKRVVHIRQGLLWYEEMIDVAFERMKTVESHKVTFLQSLLNYGTLQFGPIVKIQYVPHPGTLTRKIEQAMGLM